MAQTRTIEDLVRCQKRVREVRELLEIVNGYTGMECWSEEVKRTYNLLLANFESLDKALCDLEISTREKS